MTEKTRKDLENDLQKHHILDEGRKIFSDKWVQEGVVWALRIVAGAVLVALLSLVIINAKQ
jgi:hypothetical protein